MIARKICLRIIYMMSEILTYESHKVVRILYNNDKYKVQYIVIIFFILKLKYAMVEM